MDTNLNEDTIECLNDMRADFRKAKLAMQQAEAALRHLEQEYGLDYSDEGSALNLIKQAAKITSLDHECLAEMVTAYNF